MKRMTAKRTAVFAVFLVMTILWMGTVFGFSSKNAEESTAQSNAVTEIVLRIFNKDFDSLDEEEQQELISKCDGFIRKTAHFVAYAILGVLMYCTIGTPVYLTKRVFRSSLFSVPISVVFAITDEYHQTMVDGRAGRFTDVLIDSSGVLTGTAVVIVAVILINRYRCKRGS